MTKNKNTEQPESVQVEDINIHNDDPDRRFDLDVEEVTAIEDE